MNKRVLIFGTFDGFHAGHQFVIEEASKKGTELVAAVARDAHVRSLKNKEPQNNEQSRLARVAEDPRVAQAIMSDEELGSYHILEEIHPDLIALGFDQLALQADLERWMKEHDRQIPIEILSYAQNVGRN
ncbi:MAG: adenylyltransferase/cytidyltransferase family protein [Candidatus Uhrbacteria bacterium]|nr:adenylyltransferase/cytidyltransferase family protein [Candidatus Uhrbacteria bacterium]